MRLRTLTVLTVCLLAARASLADDVPGTAPSPGAARDATFPPELLVGRGHELGLADEQINTARREIEKAQAEFHDIEQRLRREAAKVAELLKQDLPPEDAVLAQIDRVLDLEREMKKAQVALVLRLRRSLTPAQRAKLPEVMAKAEADAARVHQSIEPKLRRVEAGVQEWQQSGRDPSAVGQVMQEFQPLMESHDFAGAEAVLDSALKILSASPPEK